MQNNQPYLSIVVPVYNAASFLKDSLAEFDAHITRFDKPVELVLVDDGSIDLSGQILAEFAAMPHPYTVIHLTNRQNKGKGFSVAYGMLSCKGTYRVFTDCDLAYPVTEIFKLLASLERGFDVAIACRVDKDSRYTISPSFFHYLYTRHLASRVLNWGLRQLLLPICRDSQAGLKGFRAVAAEEIFKRQKVSGFSFDMELLFLADRMGYLVEEIPVHYRYFDEPTTVAFMEDSFKVLRDILRIRWNGFRKAYELPYEVDNRRKLIVNADDYGFSEPTSEGILETCKDGIVRSTSIMASTVALDRSVEMLSAGPSIDLGVHFTLTYGMPACEANEVPSLVTEDGLFYSKGKFHLRHFLGKIDLEDVYREFSKQLQLLKEKGLNITHIDSHHHVHVLPGIRDVVARIALENGIKYVRAPRGFYFGRDVGAMFRQWVVGSFKGSYPQYWHRKGLHAVASFSGFHLSGGKKLLERWQQLIKDLPDGVTEVMVHPGCLDDELKDSYKVGRTIELSVLKDVELKDALNRADVDLISFKDLI